MLGNRQKPIGEVRWIYLELTRSCLQTLRPHSSVQARTLLWFFSYCNCFTREWFLCPPLQTPFSAPASTLLGSWKGPKENWQMALALKTCLPLLVSFCGPWVPLSCQCDSQGKQSRALNINRDPRPAVCFENPPKKHWRNCQLGKWSRRV